MKVLPGHDAAAVDEMVKQNIDEKSIVFSDKSANYIFGDIYDTWLDGYETWLVDVAKKRNGKSYSISTVGVYTRNLRSIFNSYL